MNSADSSHSTVDLGVRGRWRRNVLATEWIEPTDDLTAVVSSVCAPVLSADDGSAERIVVVTEKVVSIAAGLAIDARSIRVTRLARFLSRRIRPRGDSLALAVPEKMQWVIDEVGRLRVLAAAVASAVSRPFGVSGAFYLVAGRNARAVDGVRGVYPQTLIPPLDDRAASEWTDILSTALGVPVAIIDYNDRGGSVRSTTPGLPEDLVHALVADNPLGARDESTPVAVLTKV